MPLKIKLNRIKNRVVNTTANLISAPSRAKSKVRGVRADVKRGRLLHKQGFGGFREGALSIAKKGKKGKKRRR